MNVCRWFISYQVFKWSRSYLTGLPFSTEERSEEAEGPLKPAAVAEDDEKDTNERDLNEGKNSSKDPGKMWEPFTFLSPAPLPKAAHTLPHIHAY